MGHTRWVLISNIAQEPNAVELLARAMEELCIAQSLVMIHGAERGAAKYKEHGGSVRFTDTGEPMIWTEGS